MGAENMPTNEMDRWAGRERSIIFWLCIVGACRVLLFSGVFPLFNNVDEQAHFDLVYKYSHGHLPRAGVENFSREAAELMVLYRTPEYLSKLDLFPGSVLPPPAWTYPNVRELEWFSREVSRREERINHESGSFPVYYMVAGLWCAAGRLLGIEGGNLLYWIRFLNVPLFAVLVWFSYLLARTLFPDTALQRVGLPLMAAFFPQDIFYSISNDAISPLLFGVGFFLLLQVYFENKSGGYHLLTGLIVAATFLAKISNAAVLVLLGVIVLLKVKRLLQENQVKKYLLRLAILLVSVTVPIGIWLARNYVVLGNFSGQVETIEYAGWSAKPLGELWDHPICTPSGLLFFLTELTKTFWRGEFVWHLEQIASWGVDLFYIISTTALLLASGLGLILRRDKTDERQRFALTMSFCVLVVSVLLLAVLSMLYDFGTWYAPSQECPYFTFGRLISGVLLPFLVIYLDGLGRISSRLWSRLNPLIIVSIIAAVITLSELSLTLKVFTSPYNWFHLK